MNKMSKEPILDYFTCVAAASRTVATAKWPQNVRRLLWLVLFGLAWPLIKIVSFPMLMLDYVFYPGFRKVEVKEPLFIVGNWRTGSTLLYRTLARDEESVAYFTMLDSFCTAITMKRAVAWVFRVDRWLGGHFHRAMLAFDEIFLAEWSRIHDTGFLKPEEDDHILFADFASGAMFELFPMVRRFRRLFFVDREMPRIQQEFVMQRYHKLVKRQLYHLGPHKRFVSKNPMFTHKIATLSRQFPDARFVHLVRNPVNTVVSTASLFHFVWHETGALYPGEQDMETVLEFVHTGYKHAKDCSEWLEDERWVDVRFDDLVADPGGTVRMLYGHFGWSVPGSLERVLSTAGQRQKTWKTKHRYTPEQYGMSEAEIYEQFAYVYEEHDFPPPAAAAS